MRYSSVSKWGGIGVASLLAVLCACKVIYSPRTRLNHFMRKVGTVEVGKTRLDDFRQQMEKSGLSDMPFRCGERDCGYALHVENTVLSKLRLAPVTIAECTLSFRDGIASETRIMVGIEARDERGQLYPDKTIVVRQSLDVPSACYSHYDLSVKHNYRAFQGDTASVGMNPCVSAEQRARALAVNSACLTRIGGCKTVEDVLPQVFAPH